MKINEIIKGMDTKLFIQQKEWIAKQIAVLAPSGSEAVQLPEGLLNLLDQIQDAAEEELGMCFEEYELPVTELITEKCNRCGREITLPWNVKKDGLAVHCPFCGKKIMLCDYCPAGQEDSKQWCDYDRKTDLCRYDHILKEEKEIPFIYEAYGTLKVQVSNGDSIEEICQKAKRMLNSMSDDEIMKCTEYVMDSKEIDYDRVSQNS